MPRPSLCARAHSTRTKSQPLIVAARDPLPDDDIQGTGSVILGGFTNAARIASQAAGTNLHDQRILFFGAGSAGVGVAKQLLSFFQRQGFTEEEAKDRVWLVDSKGLVTKDRGDKLPEHKIFFARQDNEGKQIKELIDVIEYVKPTALMGLSTVPDTFDQKVIEKMSQINKRPIVFPLSNVSPILPFLFSPADLTSTPRLSYARLFSPHPAKPPERMHIRTSSQVVRRARRFRRRLALPRTGL